MKVHNVGFDSLLTENNDNRGKEYSSNVIVGTPHNGLLFTWRDGVGYIDISDLGPNFHFEKVYRDAEDVGITLYSPYSRRQIVYVHTGIDRDADGDITGWTFESLGPNGRPNNFLRLKIHND